MKQDTYDSYFDFWLANSPHICECCVNMKNYECDGCDKYYELTGAEVRELSYVKFFEWENKKTWDCQNTDNFEFCRKVQESVCGECLKNNFNHFESNGIIK